MYNNVLFEKIIGKKFRKMQVIDDRESRLRSALEKIEEKDGRILRESIIRLVTVSLALVYFTNLGQILRLSAHGLK